MFIGRRQEASQKKRVEDRLLLFTLRRVAAKPIGEEEGEKLGLRLIGQIAAPDDRVGLDQRRGP